MAVDMHLLVLTPAQLEVLRGMYEDARAYRLGEAASVDELDLDEDRGPIRRYDKLADMLFEENPLILHTGEGT